MHTLYTNTLNTRHLHTDNQPITSFITRILLLIQAYVLKLKHILKLALYIITVFY